MGKGSDIRKYCLFAQQCPTLVDDRVLMRGSGLLILGDNIQVVIWIIKDCAYKFCSSFGQNNLDVVSSKE